MLTRMVPIIIIKKSVDDFIRLEKKLTPVPKTPPKSKAPMISSRGDTTVEKMEKLTLEEMKTLAIAEAKA